jgi:hypothetical protein
MKVKAVIDRFESDKAVLLIGEDETALVWPLDMLPADSSEGDILRISIDIDREGTNMARSDAQKLLNQILKRNP